MLLFQIGTVVELGTLSEYNPFTTIVPKPGKFKWNVFELNFIFNSICILCLFFIVFHLNYNFLFFIFYWKLIFTFSLSTPSFGKIWFFEGWLGFSKECWVVCRRIVYSNFYWYLRYIAFFFQFFPLNDNLLFFILYKKLIFTFSLGT